MLSFITANIREEKTFSDADWDALQEGLDRFSYGASPAPRTGSKNRLRGVGETVGRALTDPNLCVPIWTAKGWMEAEIRGENLLNCRLTTITAEM